MRCVEHLAVCVIEKRFPANFLKLSTGGQRAGPFVNDSPPSADRVKVLLDFRSQGRIQFMTQIRASILAIMVLTLLAATPAFAQSQMQPQSTSKPAVTLATKAEDVSKWTTKQWNAAKAKWSNEKVKWADCQKQADEKKLSGRKSWSFLYDCMAK